MASGGDGAACPLERLPVGVLWVDASLRVCRANAAARALWPGAAGVVGERLDALLPSPALLDAVRGVFEARVGSATFCLDLPPDAAGQPRSLRATVAGRDDGCEGAPQALVAVEDTSSEAALLEQCFSAELRFEAVVGEAFDAILVASTAGFIEYANSAAERAFLATPRELVGRALSSLVVPRERPRLAQRLASASDAPHRQTFELELLRSDGQPFPGELTLGTHWLETGPSCVVTVHDLTERRAARDALAHAHEELLQLVELMPDPVAVVGDSILVYANPALHRLLRAAPGSLVGLEAQAIVVPEERPGFPPWTAPAPSESPVPGANEAHWLRRDGTTVAVERRAIALTHQGMPAWLVVARDLTSMRALAARAEQLERMIAVGTLAAGVGHEINNPMAYVISNQAQLAQGLEALEQEVAEAAAGDAAAVAAALAGISARLGELKEAVADARQGADRVRRIVVGLRAFSQASTSKRTRVNVGDVLDAAVAGCWEDLRHRAVVVRDFQRTPTVEVDDEQLRQAFSALVQNAALAMAARGGSMGELRLRLFAEGAEVISEVEDTGVGMAPEVLSRAFEPFFTTRAVGQGMGLGLFTAQATVQALGGRLTATSAPGQGSVFRVVLPAAPDRDQRGTPAHRPARGRVLLVDDEAPIRASLARALSPHHDVVPVAGGEEALALLHRGEHFDAVLCDVMMPVMSGLELLGRLRATWPDLGRRVVLMTGGTTTDRLHVELTGSRAPMLEKPFETREVLLAVARAQAGSGS